MDRSIGGIGMAMLNAMEGVLMGIGRSEWGRGEGESSLVWQGHGK